MEKQKRKPKILKTLVKLKPTSNKNDVGNNTQSLNKPKEAMVKRGAFLEALLAKIFASITTIKAAYAELQVAQNPYNGEAIRVADLVIVDELKVLSELKRNFLKNELVLSSTITLMLAELQEQQGLMKMYEITLRKQEIEMEEKVSEISELENRLHEATNANASLEMEQDSSGNSLPYGGKFDLMDLNASTFVKVLASSLRSLRHFVKLMIQAMEFAHWDVDSAARAIQPRAFFSKKSHFSFAFESFVCGQMFDCFSIFPRYKSRTRKTHSHRQEENFRAFKAVLNGSSTTKQLLSQSPKFRAFTMAKYDLIVHEKFETKLFGNLNQREMLQSGECPDSSFFSAFSEMARWMWALRLLALSFPQEVSLFQIPRNCRFSDVYMEDVTSESNWQNLRVEFTVVPGFRIGKKAIVQSQVYLSKRLDPHS